MYAALNRPVMVGLHTPKQNSQCTHMQLTEDQDMEHNAPTVVIWIHIGLT